MIMAQFMLLIHETQFNQKMKSLILMATIAISHIIIAQTPSLQGKYELNLGANSEWGKIKYELSLKSDGTFNFHFYRKLAKNPEENKYGKGTWTIKNNQVYFTSNTLDLDDNHTLNFNNSVARFKFKSPRDKSDRIVKTALIFYESSIYWVEGMQIFKVEAG